MASVTKKSSNRAGHPLLTGILIGLVLGVSLSAGVAVWVARMPNPFQNRTADGGPGASPLVAAAPASPPAAVPAPAPAAAPARSAPDASIPSPVAPPPAAGTVSGSAAGAAQPSTDAGSDTSAAGVANRGAAASPGAGAVVGKADTSLALVQVGAFANEEDALRQVETIAQVTGTRARVQGPDKGAERPLYRVRIGPMPRGQDLTELVDALKANGISSTVVRAAGADTAH